MKGLGADGPYWDALSAGELKLPRCAACGHWHWPAPFRCADCGSWEFEWVATPIEGSLYSWTRTWQPFDGTENLGTPYVSMLVELPQAGGIRLLGLASDTETPKIGAKMTGNIAASHVWGRDIPAIRWTAVAA